MGLSQGKSPDIVLKTVGLCLVWTDVFINKHTVAETAQGITSHF